MSRSTLMSGAAAVLLMTLGFMASGLTTPATAQSAKVKNACNADARRLCPQYKLDSSELRYCMESRGRSLSHGCVSALEDAGIVSRGTLARGKSDPSTGATR